jgi:peroxisomal enoyl-CoA hydratase 2
MDLSASGKTFPPYEFHVERGKIREFADALDDPNPIYRDPAYASRSPLGGIPAPPTLLRTFLYEPRAAVEALKVKDWSYIVHGEQEFEYFAPVLAGDILTAQDRIVSIIEKESRRAGKLQIAVIESTFHNQRGEKVQVARRTLVETGRRISE